MTCRDWFEYIRSQVLTLAYLESHMDELRAQAEPRGQQFDAAGHGGMAKDASAAILRMVQASEQLDRLRADTNEQIERALHVLYGKSGRGGLAKAKDSATADSICGYYLMGMSWREVASELVMPESEDASQWCKRRAYRGLEQVDEAGMMTFTET